jgi:serine/threonine protein kinase
MTLTGLLLAFGVRQLFRLGRAQLLDDGTADRAAADTGTAAERGEDGAKPIAEWLESRFTDASRRPVRAVIAANDRAWGVVGLALAEPSAFGRLREADTRNARTAIRQVLAGTSDADRARAASELSALRSRFRTGADEWDRAEVVLKRFADPAGLIADADAAAARVADEVAADAPHLAAVLRLAPDGRVPLFQAMYRHFFRKIAGRDDELSRVLAHDQLRALSELTDARTVGLLDQLGLVFDALADTDKKIEDVGVKVEAGFSGVTDTLRRIEERLAARKPGLSDASDEEHAFLLDGLKQFRKYPGRVTPQLWERLADALSDAELYPQAGEAHETAAATAQAAHDPVAEAANYHKAYLDACAAGKWKDALDAVLKAAALDEARYQPFPIYIPEHPIFTRGRYEPLGILGGGAFGTVFLCRDHNNPIPGTDEFLRVAIKALRFEVLGGTPDKVLAEAITLRGLKHDNIIGVIDQGFSDAARKRPYLVLEYFEGPTLDQLGQLPAADAVAIARRVAAALHAAHTAPTPVLHRDLKPSNIMARRNADGTWTVKVIDFGLARPAHKVASPSQSTRNRGKTGTAKYAPPEQSAERGFENVLVGPYSDVYAFGKTFLDVLFGTTSPGMLDWNTLPADVRGPLQELLERCKPEKVERRYPNFELVLKALAELDRKPPAATVRPEEPELSAEPLDIEPAPAPGPPPPAPVAPPPPPPAETHAARVARMKREAAERVARDEREAAEKNARAQALFDRYDFAGAVAVLDSFTAEHQRRRNDELLQAATVRRDRLASLDARIRPLLDREQYHHPRLPALLAEYVALHPTHPEYAPLARELEAEAPPANPNPGDVFALRAWIDAPEHAPGELTTLKVTIPAPKHAPGELLSLRWKAVAKRAPQS